MTDGSAGERRSHVHVVDDDDPFRRSLAFLLEEAGYAVRCWSGGVEFVRDLHRFDQGCVLLDLRMPDMDGLAVLRAMETRRFVLPTIVLTAHGDVSTAISSMKLGAVDYLEKPIERSAILAAVESALDAAIGGAGAKDTTAEARQRLEELSPREQEVLTLLSQGLANKEIALALKISPRTVEVHRANLMAKLKVRRLSGALRLVYATGLNGYSSLNGEGQ